MDFDEKLGLEAYSKSYEKSMDFEVKDQKILEKIRFKNNVFFDSIFLWILGGFGENLGAIWRVKNLIFQIAFFDFAFWLLQGLAQKQCALRYHT